MGLATYEATDAFPIVTSEELAASYTNCPEHHGKALLAAETIVGLATVRPHLLSDRGAMLAALAVRVQCEQASIEPFTSV